jgi:hypothetical protein
MPLLVCSFKGRMTVIYTAYVYYLYKYPSSLVAVIRFVQTTYLDGTEFTERSTYKIQTLANHPKERIQHLENGESLKSRTNLLPELLVVFVVECHVHDLNVKFIVKLKTQGINQVIYHKFFLVMLSPMKTVTEDVFLRAADITLNKQSRTIGEELSPSWTLCGLTFRHRASSI